MKTHKITSHTGILRDRAVVRGEHLLKVSIDGMAVDVCVRAEDITEAQSLHGGAVVRYDRVVGGARYFVPESNSGL